MSEVITKKYVVYQLRASDEEGPFYIGKTYSGSDRRMEHIRGRKQDARTFKAKKSNAIKSRGAEIIFEVLSIFDSEESALREECRLISFYGKRTDGTGILTNILDGGQGLSGYTHRDETKTSISKTMKNRSLIDGKHCPVSVFNLDGSFLKVFINPNDAAKSLGVGRTSIVRGIKTGGIYVLEKFQLVNGLWIDPLPPATYFRFRSAERAVLQYSISGELIGRYPTVMHAKEATGVSPGAIHGALNRPSVNPKSYFWRKETHPIE